MSDDTPRRRWPPGPLFRRSDGDLIRDEDPLRLMMPHLLWGRNASAVYHESHIDVSATRAWLRAFNRAAPRPATRFHVFLAACGRTLHERPKLNRFVSGGRLYQRKKAVVAFVAKTAPRLDAPIVTVKVDFPDPHESFISIVERVESVVSEAQTGNQQVDRQLAFGAKLPHSLVRTAMTGYRILDRFNLLPTTLIESDPSFSSVFVTNLGSLGVERTYHHLFELGTCGLIAALGRARPRLDLDRSGQPASVVSLETRWSFDERIADGFYFAAGLRRVEQYVERPTTLFGDPIQAAQGISV